MKEKLILFFLILFINSYFLFAQNSAYLIPRQIFVGDKAALVLPLPAVSQNKTDIILTPQSDYMPKDPNIDFHRVILEQRTAGSRLLIEFTAFVPGVIELPVIEIEGEYFTGLTITVNSIIDESSSPVLSGAASTLAIPGTAFMIYGFLTIIIAFFLLIILFLFKGRSLFNDTMEKLKRRRFFNSIYKTEKKLRKAVLKGVDKRIILDKLSDEFRIFLSFLTGNNCRAMTAREFEQDDNNSIFLSPFFRSCDNLRFSGTDIQSENITRLLDDLLRFLFELENKQAAVLTANPEGVKLPVQETSAAEGNTV
ncbi:MAG: hypothetical protein FWB86_03125 [Treponema sp.]|nr:hypothetical protein [Treponema sp.]MCL2251098.1 hypothetical protein [Treponema sp.]